MSDSLQNNGAATQDAACIHAMEIQDACIDKDCVEELRVYLTKDSQAALDCATSAKARSAELLHVYIDVEPISYNRGHYALDLTFYYRVIGDAMVNNLRPCTIYGVAAFSKRVVLYGGTSCAKVFSSRSRRGGCTTPEAVVEVVDPMILAAKVQDVCGCCRSDPALAELPAEVACHFDGDLVMSGEQKRLYITLGQFSTVRLERDAQLRIPTYDYCVPSKECCADAGCEESPCDAFSRVAFPVEAFFPCRQDGQSGPAATAAAAAETTRYCARNSDR